MNIINYLWSFKPTETNNIPDDIVQHNKKFITSHKIVTPFMLEPLLHTNVFPDLATLYAKIPYWVSKTDLGRLLVIYFNGGIYSDVDCFINKEFRISMGNANVALFTEHICDSVDELGPRECKNPDNVLRVANYFFASRTTQHPFLKEVIEECLSRLRQVLVDENKRSFSDSDVLYVCGPDVITTVYHKSKSKYNDIKLFDNTYLKHKAYGSWRYL